MGVGSNWPLCSSRSEPPSVLRVRADCGGRLFAAKLVVVVHYSTHQVFDQLLADQAILMAAPALLDGCNGLRTRSLKPRRVAVSNRPTVTPLSRAQLSPSARPFRLPFNKLAPSELRRIFCFSVREVLLFDTPMREHPRPVRHAGGSIGRRAPLDPNRRQGFALEPTEGSPFHEIEMQGAFVVAMRTTPRPAGTRIDGVQSSRGSFLGVQLIGPRSR